MSLRDKVQDWIDKGFTPAPSPLCSKRLVIKNLIQINQLLEDESPYIASERIKFLINDIETGKLDGGKL
jgi:hypothetical protein|tara:strand:- start:481 stop:687 length:207 start_codon:yes stop_codon:yes gene_type:complete